MLLHRKFQLVKQVIEVTFFIIIIFFMIIIHNCYPVYIFLNQKYKKDFCTVCIA